MSFGLSIGDVIRAIELAFTIHEKCFSKAHGANVKYLQFGKDIKALENILRQLQNIFSHAFSYDHQPPWRQQKGDFGPTLKPLLEITGDFNATLQECNTLLADRSRFHRSSANFVINVVWWAGTEGDINSLKERVHMHVTKTFFVTKPFEIQLLIGIRDELRALRQDIIEMKGLLIQDPLAYRSEIHVTPNLPMTPTVISDRFLAALDVNQPRLFQGVLHFPLKEGFDALVYHFAQSTIEFNPGLDPSQRVPEETQYLNLLKTKWILEKLKGSTRFEEAGPNSLWVDYMKELEKDINKEYQRFDSGQLVAPPQEGIQLLPKSCFSIWIGQAASLQRSKLAEQGPLEHKILELDLPVAPGAIKETLTILRKSDTGMRMVLSKTDEQNKDFLREQSLGFDIHQTKLIPAYAVPDESRGSSNTNNLLLACPGQEPMWHYLKSASDVELFQQALTGYRVFHDMTAVTWSLNGSKKVNKSGQGRLQLWQLDPLQPIKPDDLTISLQRMSSAATSPKPPLGSLGNRRESSIFSSSTLCSFNSVSTSVTGPRGRATAILKPAPPVMLIYTIIQGRYSFIYLPLLENLHIETESCKCRNPNNACCRVVIESNTNKIEIRRLCAQQDNIKGLYTWDLAVLGNPRHPEFAKAELVPKIKYICLDFPDVNERIKFCDEFASIVALREADNEDYERNINERRHQANHPPRREKPHLQ